METTTHTTALRRLRQEAGLSLAEVSRRTGIDKSQLSRLESGQTIPTVERLRQLGEVYGVASWKILQMMEAEHGEDREAEATHKGRATAETTAGSAAGASAS
jgi:transcriptional regulator with XRE-family HTH domain